MICGIVLRLRETPQRTNGGVWWLRESLRRKNGTGPTFPGSTNRITAAVRPCLASVALCFKARTVFREHAGRQKQPYRRYSAHPGPGRSGMQAVPGCLSPGRLLNCHHQEKEDWNYPLSLRVAAPGETVKSKFLPGGENTAVPGCHPTLRWREKGRTHSSAWK